MATLLSNHRCFELSADLEKALNRVDFFRLFHTATLSHGFDHFGVMQLGSEADTSPLTSRLVLHDLPSGLAEEYDRRHRFAGSALLKSLHASTIASVWKADDAAEDGQNIAAQLGFELLVCCPVATITGQRFAVLYFGDNEDIEKAALYGLSYESAAIFDYFARISLANKSGMGLTPRETEILRWISHGKTASEIALIVSVSEHTINSHTATILKKLDVVNRTQMVAKAIREQIIQ
ncbi:helix-turn-helix transcriptional regulator [Rhizobium sp. YIM 134829]|uniref:helix-turn-helix transcriptional regulator n=1 Tax=Rhizobium sp. YIM 134829 TaxID=3390453 RepID=UPI00397CB9AD